MRQDHAALLAAAGDAGVGRPLTRVVQRHGVHGTGHPQRTRVGVARARLPLRVHRQLRVALLDDVHRLRPAQSNSIVVDEMNVRWHKKE